MSRSCKKAFSTAMLFLSLCLKGMTQQLPDSSNVQGVETALEIYHQAVFPESVLYNGSEYLDSKLIFVEGQPYFLSLSPLPGSIIYDGILFKPVSLMYDLLRDQLIVIHPSNHFRIELTASKVNRFIADGHQFINIRPDTLSKQSIKPGYYELLYEGKHVTLVKKLRKVILEELSSTDGVLNHLKDKNAFYIKKENNYYPVSNKNSLLNIFNDKRSEMQQLLRKHKIQRKGNNDETYRLACRYYDSLKNLK
jgi:hypothetical protein